MSQFQEQLKKAADKNHELLLVLRESEYAPPALKQNTEYVADLKSQIEKTDKELQSLQAKREQEEKEHVKIRDSVMRRYAYKLGGHKGQEKFSSKQEKEEREYLEAAQKELEAKERREELGKALDKGDKEQHQLKDDAWKHDQAQAELDQLYRDIFSGPTPEVPGEDQKEEAVNQALTSFQGCQQQLGRDKQAKEALQRASRSLSLAMRDMGDAHDSSNMDRFGGGALFDMMERDSMSKAQVNLTECQRAIGDARAAQPQITALSDVSIDHGHVMSDILFDSVFADFAQHDRIKASEQQMYKAMDHLQSMIKEQDQRLKSAQDQHWQASKHLEDSRAALQQIRAQAFEQLPANS